MKLKSQILTGAVLALLAVNIWLWYESGGTEDQRLECHVQGISDFISKVNYSDCPYSVRWQIREWRTGWSEAKERKKQRKAEDRGVWQRD